MAFSGLDSSRGPGVEDAAEEAFGEASVRDFDINRNGAGGCADAEAEDRVERYDAAYLAAAPKKSIRA